MRISREQLMVQASATGFRPEILEKAACLLTLLESLQRHPFLRDKLVLKGGTALNLFILQIPRLSVDIDLNYVGAADRDTMVVERPRIDDAIKAACEREDLTVRREPQAGGHAGGKWLLRYESAMGQSGNLELDVNFMFRVPLWPADPRNSHRLGAWQATGIPVLDEHELAAGKIAALLARRQARDLFDACLFLRSRRLDKQRLRIAFVVYGAMNRKDWRTVTLDDVTFEAPELAAQLLPLLRREEADIAGDPAGYGKRLVEECRQGLGALLPLGDAELEFLDLLLDKGEIDPTLLTGDPVLQQRIRMQPMLEWKARHVRQHKGMP